MQAHLLSLIACQTPVQAFFWLVFQLGSDMPEQPHAACLHFFGAQVLWKSTTSVGCAVQHCPSVPGFGNGYFVQCNYSPPGNVLGQFPQNVLPQ